MAFGEDRLRRPRAWPGVYLSTVALLCLSQPALAQGEGENKAVRMHSSPDAVWPVTLLSLSQPALAQGEGENKAVRMHSSPDAVWPVTLLSLSQPALAQVEGENKSVVRIHSSPDAGWPEAEVAIAFELNQAGYTVESYVAAEQLDNATLEVGVTLQGWTLVFCGADHECIESEGPPGTDASLVALHAVELVLGSTWGAPRVQPQSLEVPSEPETLATQRPALDPWSAPTEQPIDLGAHEVPNRPRRWGVAVSSGLSTVGLVSLGMGVRRTWVGLDLGFAIDGALLGRQTEMVEAQGLSAIEGGGVARFRLQANYAFFSGRRVRPGLGIVSEWIVPVVHSRYEGADLDVDIPGATISNDGTNAGLVWVPAVSLSLRVALRRRLTLELGARVGPAVHAVPVRLANGEDFALPGWFAGASVGFVFGPTGWKSGPQRPSLAMASKPPG